MPMLNVNEMFISIQGEGSLVGTPTLFIRFHGCNLNCPFCDTQKTKDDFTPRDYGKFMGDIVDLLEFNRQIRHVVFTGGEPMLTMQYSLEWFRAAIHAIKNEYDVTIGIETNGTIKIPNELPIDHISFSPKTHIKKIQITRCTDLKILYPFLDEVHPSDYINFPAENRFLQPIETGNSKRDGEIITDAVDTVIGFGNE